MKYEELGVDVKSSTVGNSVRDGLILFVCFALVFFTEKRLCFHLLLCIFQPVVQREPKRRKGKGEEVVIL